MSERAPALENSGEGSSIGKSRRVIAAAPIQFQESIAVSDMLRMAKAGRDLGRNERHARLFRRPFHFRIDAMGVLARIGAEQRDHARLIELEAERFHTSTKASTRSATWASLWAGVGVTRKRSVPLATVG